MASWQRRGKLKANYYEALLFISSSERLIVTLPVENMSNTLLPERILGVDALASIAAVVARHLPRGKLLLVYDDTTWEAAGKQVQAQLAGDGLLVLCPQGTRLRAERSTAEAIIAQAADCSALLAIGSGTINDLTKYAAAQVNKPYGVVATAASMNGYTAANASLLEGGHKHSFAARPPAFVLADSGVLAASPKRLTRAGLGDTLCRSTVEADMLLSHFLLETPYPREIFDRLRRHETTLLQGSMNNGDHEAATLTTLMEALLDAGDAMTEHGSSAVASQSEHMIAHTLEMKYGNELHHVLHGELIAITSVTMSQLQQRMLLGTPQVKPLPCVTEQFGLLFGNQQATSLVAGYQTKLLDVDRAAHINARLAVHWPEIRTALQTIMTPSNTLERALIQSGVRTKPMQIGLAEERYRFATSYAHLTRDRFTFLDLAAMNGKRAV